MSAPTRSGKRKSLAARRRQLRFVIVGLFTALIVAGLSGAVYVLHLPQVTITSVGVTDGDYIDAAAVQSTAESLLAGSYGFVIPRAFTFLYPRTGIITSIHASFPSIKDVVVERRGLTALAVTVIERIPVARWCMSDQCYFMDDTGMVFAKADSVSGLAYSGLIEGDPSGQTFLDGEFAMLADFMTALPRATGRTPISALVDASDDVYVTLQEGGVIKFNLSSDLANVLANVTTTFASKQFSSGQSFDYADFRFGNKVYVKWK